MAKKIMLYGSIAGALTAIIALYTTLDLPTPAFEHDVLEVASKANQNSLAILYIQRNGLQNQIWALEDRIAAGKGTQDTKNSLRRMRLELDRLDRKIRKMEK
jgi:hypothetical protein